MASIPESRSAWTRTGVPRSGVWRICALVLAIVLGLFGLALLAGGIWLIVLGGSWYYALAGVGLSVTAWLIAAQRRAALPVYLLVWVLTVIWAFWEVGTDWWAQVPRLVAPTVVLILILLVLPALGRRRNRRPRGARRHDRPATARLLRVGQKYFQE